MPIFYIPDAIGLTLCFLLWPIFQVSAALVCSALPDSFFKGDRFWFRTHDFEKNGYVYEKLFNVRRWKRYLPDGAAVQKGGYRKKKMTDFSGTNLEKFLVESRRAELSHLAAIPPFILFGLFEPAGVVLLMLAYALLVNAPCIIAQRYNRPRVARLLNAKHDKES